MDSTRRSALRTGLVVGSAALVTGAANAAGAAPRADARPTAAAVIPRSDPFTLGVASGDPEPDGFVIWTRLALDPLAADGLGGMPSSRFQAQLAGRDG